MALSKQTDLPSLLGLPPLPSQSPDTIAALMWAREVLQKSKAQNYSVKDPAGIEELKAINIGGVDQWLHIRGRDRSNPVLLYLTGGPGAAVIGAMDEVQRPWEDYFTVVQWDQRQFGKSYYAADDKNNPLTIEQYINDTEELIHYLLGYLNKEKLFLAGSSWGTLLGMQMVKRHPEWLYAYVGIGQVVNIMEGERVMSERLLEHAKEQNNEEVISYLESIQSYPDPGCPDKSFIENGTYIRTELNRLAGETHMHYLLDEHFFELWVFGKLISPHISLTDLSNSILGDPNVLFRDLEFTKQFMAIDLPRELGNTFDVPIFFFTGRHDWQTPVTLSDQWFSEIEAPHKELIHFEKSAHIVSAEEPGKFLMELINKVLPFSQNNLS